MLMVVRRPKLFKLLSSKAQRMFRKFLEPKPDKRPKSLKELARYLDDRWLAKSTMEKQNSEYQINLKLKSGGV